MTAARILTPRRYARLLALLAGTGLLLAALGYLPTARLAGPAGLVAMAAGIGVSLVATAVGALPLLAPARGGTGASALLAAMVLRFAVAAVLALVLALSGLLPRTPVLLWIGLSYLAMLAADAAYTARLAATPAAGHPGG
ncbi:MAG: hypothetical protein KJ058_09705 [Thermoanaerobaculia bacterium]|nr:hypothetical protein [Thermoanaerobaculia bacterium]MCZ7652789.1 hypothetical protein [Thermoanaerobaculia bacterium]